jgi:dipeptidyl aminopeptidase/acylaminoacyl peptidase
MASRTSRRRPPTQDDLYDIEYVCEATLSPDGTQAAYVLAETVGTGEKEKQSLSIWLVATTGGKPRQLTRGKGSDYHPRFARDGQSIFFLSTRDKRPQIYRLPIDGGEPTALTELAQGVGAFELAPDGKSLAFVAPDKAPQPPGDEDHVRIDRSWYRFDPVPGYLHDVRHTIYLLRIGGKPKPLTKPGGLILGLAFSPDGREVAHLKTSLEQHQFVEANLDVVTIESKAVRTLVANKLLNQLAWTADGTRLVCTGSLTDLADQNAVLSVDATTGRTSDRTSALDLMVGTGVQGHVPVRIPNALIPSADGKSIHTTVTIGGAANVHEIALAGGKRATAISTRERLCHLADARDHGFLIISQEPNDPPALFWLNANGEEIRLTHHNDAWQAQFQWPTVEHLWVDSAKGVRVEGWVLKPRHVRAPYRTLLMIHGGPHSAYGYGFGFDFQELVGAGYAVAYINPRGSTGYGNGFARAILGRWGDLELKDFHAFLDELIRRGIAHPDRLGVTGISGGGHLSSWLIGHTDRFKAAVPEQGVYNMVSMWGTSDAGKVLLELELGGPLHRMPMTYWERSPVAYAHRCRTPTLLLQGEDDVRCPMEQAEQLYAALVEHGCEAEFIRMRKCNHGAQIGGRPALRRFRMNALKDWFDRHIP